MVGLAGPKSIIKFVESVRGLPIPHGLYHLGRNTSGQEGGGRRTPCGVGGPIGQTTLLEIAGCDGIYCATFYGRPGFDCPRKGAKQV